MTGLRTRMSIFCLSPKHDIILILNVRVRFCRTILSTDYVEYCIVNVAARGRSAVPKTTVGKAMREERNALFPNMGVHEIRIQNR